MTAEEISEVVIAYVGNWVWVRHIGSLHALVWLLGADAEGCTCRVADLPDYSENETYWLDVYEIAEAKPYPDERLHLHTDALGKDEVVSQAGPHTQCVLPS